MVLREGRYKLPKVALWVVESDQVQDSRCYGQAAGFKGFDIYIPALLTEIS